MITFTEEELDNMSAVLHAYKSAYRGNMDTDSFSICPLCGSIYEEEEGCSCDNDD